MGQASGIIIDKLTLSIKRVEVKVFIPLLFLYLFILTGIFMPWFGEMAHDAIKLRWILLFVAMLVIAIVWNIFYYKALQKEKLYEFEMVMMTQPLVTIILASIVFASERDVRIIIPSVLAGIALIAAHIRRHHLDFGKNWYSLFGAVIFMSIELLFIKELLSVYSPVALYFFRTGLIFAFFSFYYRPRIEQVSFKNHGLVLATSATGVLQMVLKFYGFEQVGIVFTTLVMLAAPVLVYATSHFVFGEKAKLKSIVAAIIIMACIAYGIIIKEYGG